MHGEQRLIIATCEKGTVEDVNDMKDIKAGLDTIRAAHPNFVDMASKKKFSVPSMQKLSPIRCRSEDGQAGAKAQRNAASSWKAARKSASVFLVSSTSTPTHRYSTAISKAWACSQRILFIPTTPVLNFIALEPAEARSISASPAKIGISHVYNLIQEKHRKKPLNVIFFPMYDVLHSPLVKIVAANACPTVTATPETVKAAFTKENDVFAEHNVQYLAPVLNFADRKLFAHQMLQAWQPILGLSQEENDRAVESGFAALQEYESGIRRACAPGAR